MRAAAHPDEAKRIAALRSYGILDTPRESSFDEVVELVAEICEAPIAVVNLIDEDRQWFKAEVGLGVRETPLETSICAHVILSPGLTVIPDTLGDDRLRGNPLCGGDMNLRFYAGMCLETEQGLPIGTLCVLDTKPRDLSDHQKKALAVMGRQVMRQIELSKALKNARMLQQEMNHRVKNSLSIVQALLSMQAKGEKNASAVEALENARGRISAIAAIHDQLQTAPSADTVLADEFIEQLRGSLAFKTGDHSTLSISVAPCSLNIEHAVDMGIIINELVTNAVKHGADAEGVSIISVTGRRVGDRLRIIVADRGAGLPGDFDPGEKSGLGMRVVMALSRKLGAPLAWETTEAGAAFHFSAPIAP